MANVYMEMVVGEERPIYVSSEAEDGVLQVAENPAPTITLYARSSYFEPLTVVLGYDQIPATGYTQTQEAEVAVWYYLNTASLEGGRYLLVFDYQVLAEDGMTREEVVSIAINLLSVEEL